MFARRSRRCSRWLVLPDLSYAVDDLAKADDGDLRGRGLALQARLALWLMRDAALLLHRAAGWLDDRDRGGRRARARVLEQESVQEVAS